LSRFRPFIPLIALSLLVAACTSPGAPQTERPETTADATAEADGAEGAVDNLDDVETAVIQVVAEGSFVDPEFGTVQGAGSGSGFIIDPEGIAVTNNHVVTGSALLQVYVSGEDDPVNADVLGVSECSDLAVIDLDGEGYPFLDWYDDEIDTGLDIFAAGFPLGDPEFTLTGGIVSKSEADGETPWASVDSVIEHDAAIQPGNSGGPLVTEDGQVVGVNYAGFEGPTGTEQFFAIGRDEAVDVIEDLREGENVDAIGINGQAVASEDGSLTGVWVASVESGSPADDVGVEGGDVITQIEGLTLGDDGTMSDYCDILRSHDPEEELAVTVLRFATDEVLEGRLPDQSLEVATCFACLPEEEEGMPEEGGASYDEYTEVTDDTGAIIMEVPADWTDTNGSAWVLEEVEIGVAVSASPDLDAYYDTWVTPGVFFGVSRQLIAQYDEESYLDTIDFSDVCTYDSRSDYSDPVFTGFYDLYTDCDGEGSAYLVLAATPEDRAYLVHVEMVLVTEADFEAADRILATFNVVGDLP
jgi:serine protease Do